MPSLLPCEPFYVRYISRYHVTGNKFETGFCEEEQKGVIRDREIPQSGRWSGCVGHLKTATVRPDLRRVSVRRALDAIARRLPASGVALVRPGSDRLVEYVGERDARRWLCERIAPTTAETLRAFSEGASRPSGSPPAVLPLGRESGHHHAGLLLITDYRGPGISDDLPGDVRLALETLIEVETIERTCLGEGVSLADLDFLRPLSGARQRGDSDGLTEMLALAREVGGADFTYWGSVHEGVVDVTSNVGARDSGFGFELPLGEGLGGRAFDRGEAFEVLDYLNCQYRYPGVSEATDSEKVRTALAVPIHGDGSGAVLYAVRREVEAFSPAQLAMLTQIRNAIEPLSGGWTSPKRLYPSGLDHLRLQKTELRRLLLKSDRVRDLESWLERLLRGTAILLDGSGHPYVPTNLSRLERMETRRPDTRHTFPLPDGRASGGDLHLWTDLELPLEGWPDLMEDALAAFGVVMDRVEQAHERLSRQRSHWLQSVASATGEATDDLLRDGNRLGLPAQGGEVWSFAWDTEREQPRLWMLADDVVLDLLGGPLISVGDGVGVVLLREPCRKDPSAVRDELLRHVGPTPLWLAHGASYESFDRLRGALLRSTSAATGLRRSDNGAYLTEVNGRDLDSLLGNPTLSEELVAFTDKMLAPLTDHDARKNTKLTETFCRTLSSGSPAEAAKELYVHPNTVRYRMRQAEDILCADLAVPKERTALCLAAFIWLGRANTR